MTSVVAGTLRLAGRLMAQFHAVDQKQKPARLGRLLSGNV
jgi:hypothetical protein